MKNVDGQTSFLNEVQRRRDFTELKRHPETASLFTHIVDTHYASLREGIILSPWIEGERLQHFDARVFDQLFGTIVHHFTPLEEQQGLFFGDEERTQAELIARYQALRDKAVEYQLPAPGA